jgi:transcriptional regulator with XRE-family HTH domain
MHLGEKIKYYADLQGFTPSDLASKLDKSTTAIYDIFRKPHISTEILEKFAEIFAIPLTSFFNETEKEIEKVIEVTEKPKNNSSKSVKTLDDKVIELYERQIGLLQNENTFLKGLINKYQGGGSSQSLGKNKEMEHSQPNTPTGQAPTFSGESAPAGK